MSEQYDKSIAYHYSSYRPPLHQMILDLVFKEKQIFTIGADIGCGTGYSAVALTKYCSQVYGIEPSQSMLAQAVPHNQITYLLGNGNNLPVLENSIDVITFAGSLYYAKSEFLMEELKRVCKHHSIIIAYDFEVLLDTIISHFGLKAADSLLDYDYEVNFAGNEDFEEYITEKRQILLSVTASELAHILFSELKYYEAFLKRYQQKDPFLSLVEELERINHRQELKVNIYFSKYRIHNS